MSPLYFIRSKKFILIEMHCISFSGLLASKDPNDQKMVDFMVNLWTNFAMFHDPTPDDHSWPAYGTNDVTYIRLKNSEIIYERDTVRDANAEMWIKLLK